MGNCIKSCLKCGGQVYPEWDRHTHKNINVCIQCGYCLEDDEKLPLVKERSISSIIKRGSIQTPTLH